MNIFKASISVCLMLSAFTLNAQKVTMKRGGQTKLLLKKGSESVNFTANGNNYFVTTVFEQAVTKFYLESFDNSGAVLAQKQLEVPGGVFNNSFGINELAAMNGNVYALVEHLDKPSGKNSLLGRVMSPSGDISSSEVELMSMAFEKTMNSGYNYTAVSEDKNTLAVVGLLPHEKEAPAKLKVALFDKDLKKKSETSFSLPGEDTKNKRIKVVVANDGTVYLIKQTYLKNGEMALTIYQNSGTPDLKEYTFEMAAPEYFTTYAYATTPANELVISGTYYVRKTVTVGDRQTAGIFFFTNKGKSEKVFNTFKLDAPVENLTARKVLVNGNTIFLAAEQYKEEKIAPPASAAGSAAAFDYNYNYIHRNEYAIAMDADGNKKFELNMAKDFTARDFDKQHNSAYFICNGKLTVIYNDQTSKYNPGYSYSSIIPVLVQITNDGLMQSPVVFKDDLKLPQYFLLYPSFSVQNSPNEISMLMKNHELSQYVKLVIE